jgi:hypothetical protein
MRGGGSTLPKSKKIICYSSLDKYLEEVPKSSLVWACDVLHHLPEDFLAKFLGEIVKKTDLIIIKDIDKRHRFGNFMNRLHDRIINREIIHDVNPNKLQDYFISLGFKCDYYYLPKLWYPHFILVADRKKKNEIA